MHEPTHEKKNRKNTQNKETEKEFREELSSTKQRITLGTKSQVGWIRSKTKGKWLKRYTENGYILVCIKAEGPIQEIRYNLQKTQ